MMFYIWYVAYPMIDIHISISRDGTCSQKWKSQTELRPIRFLWSPSPKSDYFFEQNVTRRLYSMEIMGIHRYQNRQSHTQTENARWSNSSESIVLQKKGFGCIWCRKWVICYCKRSTLANRSCLWQKFSSTLFQLYSGSVPQRRAFTVKAMIVYELFLGGRPKKKENGQI